MAATTTINQPRTTNEVSKKGLYWGIAIAALVVFALLFSIRGARNDLSTTSTTASDSVITTTATAPAVNTTTADSLAQPMANSQGIDNQAIRNQNAAAAGSTNSGYNVDNGTMDLNNQPNDRLTTPNAANPNPRTTK